MIFGFKESGELSVGLSINVENQPPEDAELGLNEHHHSTVVNYMRFARYKRNQNLRGVEGCFQDLKDSRLTEDTFTMDEVTEMLDGLEAVVRGEVESELINTAHTNVLLLRQLFIQAEKWHLKLQADISELENRELIEMIADFEEAELSGKASNKPTFELKRLDPVESGGIQLLQAEIDRLNEENSKLKDRLKQVEDRASHALDDKSKLQTDLSRTQEELGSLRDNKTHNSGQDTSEFEGQMAKVKEEMEQNLKLSSDKASALENDLTSTKLKVLEMQEQLELTEKELDKKFRETGAFKNLKSMLAKKNEQIKDLRKSLKKYEPDD